MTLSWLDPLGAILSISATFYFTRASKLAWPLSICAILMNTLLYGTKGIYGQMGLEFAYLLSCIYGWIFWGARSHHKQLPISHIPISILAPSLPMLGLMIYGLTLFLKAYTNSTIPFWDAVTTVLGLYAQLMICRKWIESWMLWFVVDCMTVIIHWTKGIPFHSGIHLIYLGLAVMGYLRWRKLIIDQRHGLSLTDKRRVSDLAIS